MSGVAVVTIAHGRHTHLRRQVESLARAPGVARHVVVAMGDADLLRFADPSTGREVVEVAADPAALPLAAARNLGAETALRRGADVLVFLDVDCLVAPELPAAYEAVSRRHPRAVWSGPVTYLPAGLSEDELREPWRHDDPHPARPAPGPGQVVPDAAPEDFWSLSFALHRDAWAAVGGFCEDYVGYGGEDTDFGFLALERGLRLGWVGDARAYHQHHPTHDPPVQHVADVVRNATIFHRRWGRWPMLGWLEAFEAAGLAERTSAGWRAVDA